MRICGRGWLAEDHARQQEGNENQREDLNKAPVRSL
jgi:hypothetical protein